jgi:hypothetical protein
MNAGNQTRKNAGIPTTSKKPDLFCEIAAGGRGAWPSVRRPSPPGPVRWKGPRIDQDRSGSRQQTVLLVAQPIGRMPSVDRPAISIDIGAVSIQLGQLLGAVVMCSTQALQRTEPKGPLVLLMRHNVVGYCGGADHALLQAHRAQRMFSQLMTRTLAPTLPAIPRHALAQCQHLGFGIQPPIMRNQLGADACSRPDSLKRVCSRYPKKQNVGSDKRPASHEPTPLCFVRRKSGDYLRQMAEVGAKLRPKNGTREELCRKRLSVKALRLDHVVLRRRDVNETTEIVGEYRSGSA